MDSGADPFLTANVTSNGYVMAAETATYVVDQLNGKGSVVMFIFEPYPPVQKRGAIAESIFNNEPDIKIMEKITPSFDRGPLEGARNAMEAVLPLILRKAAYKQSGPPGMTLHWAPNKPSVMLAVKTKAL